MRTTTGITKRREQETRVGKNVRVRVVMETGEGESEKDREGAGKAPERSYAAAAAGAGPCSLGRGEVTQTEGLMDRVGATVQWWRCSNATDFISKRHFQSGPGMGLEAGLLRALLGSCKPVRPA